MRLRSCVTSGNSRFFIFHSYSHSHLPPCAFFFYLFFFPVESSLLLTHVLMVKGDKPPPVMALSISLELRHVLGTENFLFFFSLSNEIKSGSVGFLNSYFSEGY